jgi:hypothetical protein
VGSTMVKLKRSDWCQEGELINEQQWVKSGNHENDISGSRSIQRCFKKAFCMIDYINNK